MLVLGASGLLGPGIAQILVKEGFRATAHVGGDGDLPALRGVTTWRQELAPAAADPSIEVPAADAAIFARPIDPGDAAPEELQAVALERLAAEFEIAKRAGVQRWVVISGIEAAGPLTWERGLEYENIDPAPVIHIGGALREMEREVVRLVGAAGGSLVILRPGHLYGEGEPGFLDQVIQILTGPDRELVRAEWANRRFQPVHARDVARVAVAAVTRGEGIYHITDGTCPTVGHIVRDIQGVGRLKGLHLPSVRPPLRARPDRGRIHYAFPADRAMRDLQYQPGWTLSAGTAALVDELHLEKRTASGLSRIVHRSRQDADALLDEEAGVTIAAGADGEQLAQDWADDQRLTDVLHRPVFRFVRDVLRRSAATRVLDFGCGDGAWSRTLAKDSGVRIIGVDGSAGRIRRAIELAEADGVSDRVEYQKANLFNFTVDEKVDAVCCFGSIQHLPDIERQLPMILERNLRPGGVLLAIGRHCDDGYHPSLLRFMQNAKGSWASRFFDIHRYEATVDVGGPLRLDEVSPTAAMRMRAPELDRWLPSRYAPLRMGHTHFLAPFIANAFVVYQRSPGVRRLTRLVLPAVLRLDGWLCRFPQFRSWAALGMYAVRYEGT